MFRKIVDVLKEVFWIKPSRKKYRPASVKKASVKKKTVKKKAKTTVFPKSKPQSDLSVPKKQPKSAKPPVKAIDPLLTQAGVITHYFERIKVCVVKITQGTILIGDKLTIVGLKTKFVQKVWSMQIESEDVKVAQKGQIIGLKVDKAVAVGDKVYKA